MNPRPVPDHGTYARANGSPGYRPPCDCEHCLPVKRKTRKRHKVNRQLGKGALIDATPARERLQLLKQTMSWQAICAATGCNDGNLSRIHAGQRLQINRTTHNKIMAVRPATKTDSVLPIDATGTARRIQALFAIGNSRRVIAETADAAESYLQKIANGEVATVTQGFADRIAAAYKRLAHRPVPVNRFTARTRSISAAKGWHGPLAWDGNIDDPSADPDTTGATTTHIAPKRDKHRNDEIKHLASFGIPAKEIGDRVGLDEKDVAERLKKWAREDRGEKQAVSA